MRSADRVRTELLSGVKLILQRVPRLTSADDVANDIGGTVAIDPLCLPQGAGPFVVDLRQTDVAALRESLPDLDRNRHRLMGGPPLVVLLDASRGALAAQLAPHTCSIAGGVRLPAEQTARLARTDDEIAMGQRLLHAALEDLPAGDRLRGALAGVDLLTERLFCRRGEDPRHLAAEALDEAVLYAEYLP